MAAHLGGSAALAALIGGVLLKQLNPKPWTWPRQLGTAASLRQHMRAELGVSPLAYRKTFRVPSHIL